MPSKRTLERMAANSARPTRLLRAAAPALPAVAFGPPPIGATGPPARSTSIRRSSSGSRSSMAGSGSLTPPTRTQQRLDAIGTRPIRTLATAPPRETPQAQGSPGAGRTVRQSTERYGVESRPPVTTLGRPSTRAATPTSFRPGERGLDGGGANMPGLSIRPPHRPATQFGKHEAPAGGGSGAGSGADASGPQRSRYNAAALPGASNYAGPMEVSPSPPPQRQGFAPVPYGTWNGLQYEDVWMGGPSPRHQSERDSPVAYERYDWRTDPDNFEFDLGSIESPPQMFPNPEPSPLPYDQEQAAVTDPSARNLAWLAPAPAPQSREAPETSSAGPMTARPQLLSAHGRGAGATNTWNQAHRADPEYRAREYADSAERRRIARRNRSPATAERERKRDRARKYSKRHGTGNEGAPDN
ncbi:hypothetical protein LTR53_002549 [Teratosphaeriaceae sp. CCFEE 6253]|nr:hypothetical protein LTR53_002549 [Teratosphaeriaceae sp. CCFEE 6253]